MVFKTRAALLQPTHSYYMSRWCIDASSCCPHTVYRGSGKLEMFALTQSSAPHSDSQDSTMHSDYFRVQQRLELEKYFIFCVFISSHTTPVTYR